jgi:hypothetical protein
MENKEKNPSKREQDIAYKQHQEMIKQRDAQLTQMKKRLEWLQTTVLTREFEEKVFGQDNVIRNLRHDASIDALVFCGKTDIEVLEYLVSKQYASPEDEQMLSELMNSPVLAKEEYKQEEEK